MRRWIPVLVLFQALTPLPGLAAGDAAAGKTKAYTCTGCHGIPGYNNVYPTYKVPRVGGQNYEYLVSALNAYKSGARVHATMNSQALGLSQTDIEDISAWLSSLTGNPAAE
jgi:cytochrome c553